jgi:hypothetical protein
MKQLRNNRKMLVVSLVILLAAVLAGPALAGGWAVITLDELPGEIHAGENVHLSFMVRQHGETPVHDLGSPSMPIEPRLTAHNSATGETFTITAVPEKEVGRFSLDVVFPSEGSWTWSISPDPLAGTTEFAPLMILPAVEVPVTNLETTTVSTAAESAALASAPAAAAAADAPDLAPILRGAAVLLLAAGALTAFLAVRRKEPRTAVVEAGD